MKRAISNEEGTKSPLQSIPEFLEELGLKITNTSPTADDDLRLNYSIKITRGNRVVYDGPYSMGYGHLSLPNPKKKPDLKTAWSCSSGENSILEALRRPSPPRLDQFKDKELVKGLVVKLAGIQKLTPKLPDVMYSLLTDAQCGDGSFKNFCSELGYDEDSRKAEEIWKACNDTHYALRDAFTTKERTKLEALFQDY